MVEQQQKRQVGYNDGGSPHRGKALVFLKPAAWRRLAATIVTSPVGNWPWNH